MKNNLVYLFNINTKMNFSNISKVSFSQKEYIKLNNSSIRIDKSDSMLKCITLPEESLDHSLSLKDALVGRYSCRKFSAEIGINLKELSTILKYSAGIREKIGGFSFKYIPTAGALNSIDTYIINWSSCPIEVGAYYYNPFMHRLENLNINEAEIHECIHDFIGCKSFINKKTIAICLVANLEKICSKYNNRGFRYALVEAGHLCQNISIMSSALGLGVCSVGGTIDHNIEKVLKIDGENQTLVCATLVGCIEK